MGGQRDVGRGLGGNPYRRSHYGPYRRRVHPALIALLVIVLIGFFIRVFFL